MIRGFALIAFFVCSAEASQVHTLNEEREILVSVSNTELNRIIVEKDRISDVFTHGTNLEILPDERIGQIFVKTGSSPKGGIRLTLTTEEGRVQDMRLRAQELQGQTIIIKERGEFEVQPENPNKQEGLVAILLKFLSGEQPIGFKLCDSGEEQKVYSSDHYTVEVFPHTNSSEQVVHLDEEIFVSHSQVRAILIDCPLLEPGESTRIWRISAHD